MTPGASWQLSPITTLRVSGTYVAERFERRDLLGSPLYRVEGALEQREACELRGSRPLSRVSLHDHRS